MDEEIRNDPEGKKDIAGRMKGFCGRHPVMAFFITCLAAGFFLSVIYTGLSLLQDMSYGIGLTDLMKAPVYMFSGSFFFGLFFVYPLLISLVDLKGIFDLENSRTYHVFALMTIVSGIFMSKLYLDLSDIMIVDWSEQLYNQQMHSPVLTKAIVPLIAIGVLAFFAYLILAGKRAYEMPPLLIVICMAVLYVWGIICILWCIQISGGKDKAFPADSLPLMVLPLDCLLIIGREIRIKIVEWNKEAGSHSQKEWTGRWNALLRRAEFWPLYALIATLPILGVILCVLALFGQAPDILIRAFTETADWRLSEKIAVPNIQYDEHYLCTVAAGGDERIVKPLRMGERHGHRVVVNRQLQIANAFEQVLEERMPKTHRVIRHVYDTYGFPIARAINKKWICDLVYLLMKPLEWSFLAVLYLADVHPEDRIAVQYLPKR